MSNLTSDLSKASVALACVMTLSAINGTTVQAQTTFSGELDKSHPIEAVASQSPQETPTVELVVESGIVDYQRAIRKNRLFRKFQQLAKQWREQRGSMSSIEEMSMLAPYQNIIGIGSDAIPMILAQLKTEGGDPDQWFWALMSIAEANELDLPQIKTEDQGNFKKMAEAWLEWGESQGYAG